MVRVSHPKHGKQAAPSNGLRGAKVSKQRNRHKVVFEDVEQKKQKSLYFRTDPPLGYTFIPAGNPQLTEALKEVAKKGNHETFAVTTTPHASRHELSREVHRIGWHFPTEVVARVCNYYGIRLTASGKLVEDKDDDKLFMKVYQKGQLVLDEKVHDQVTINTDAKQIIKDLFPNIPDNDLFKIIKTAFQVGDGKVGTADEIPLVRRAQLSVVAHIRHTYTNYDKLLRQVPYNEARHSVENETLKKLIEWRGDDDNKEAVEDTLREVVVISDEEGSDNEVEDGQILENEDVRVQLVSDATRQDHPSSHRHQSPIEQYSADNGYSAGFRYVPQIVRRIPLPDQPELNAARQRSRYAVWDRYRQEYRTATAPQPPQVVRRIMLEEPAEHSVSYPPTNRIVSYETEPQRIIEQPVSAVSQPSTPTYVRGTDGRLYERIVRHTEDFNGKLPLREDYSSSPPTAGLRHLEARPASPRPYPIQMHPHKRNVSLDESDGTVMPSIEGSNSTYYSSPHTRYPQDHPTKRYSTGNRYPIQQDPPIDSPASINPSAKRQRVQITPPSSFTREPQYAAQYLDRGDVQQQHYQTRDNQRYIQRVYEAGDMSDDLSSRMLRQQVIHDPVVNSTGTRSAGNMISSYSTPRDIYPLQVSHGVTQPDQTRPIYYVDANDNRHHHYAPLRVESNRPRTYVTSDGMPYDAHSTNLPQAATSRIGQPEPIRYVQVHDGNTLQRSGFVPEQAPVSHLQRAEYVPLDMTRRTSAQNRGYETVVKPPTAYHQPMVQQTSQSRR